jgi:HD-GYP domain-containing protein (c-di-GMP phosphodiesterase class II)
MLVGSQIPLEARILAVCDAFEAMTSNRDFRTALSVARAITEIDGRSGTQFDPEVASAFNRMVARLHGQTMRDRIRSVGVSRT